MKRHIRRVLMVWAALVTLVPGAALADARVRYTNQTDHVLHVYYRVAAYGADIDCRTLIYWGALSVGSSWEHFAPSEHWTSVRFLNERRGGGCADQEGARRMYFHGGDYPYRVLPILDGE